MITKHFLFRLLLLITSQISIYLKRFRFDRSAEQNRTKLLFSYISQATIWHMRIITYTITFYFKVQVWRNIISMVTVLSVVLIFGTSNMDYIFSYMLLFVEKMKIRERERERVREKVRVHNSIKSKPLLECFLKYF